MRRRLIQALDFTPAIAVRDLQDRLVQTMPYTESGLHVPADVQANLRARLSSPACPCCGSLLVQVYHKSVMDDNVPEDLRYEIAGRTVVACNACGMWRAELRHSIEPTIFIVPYLWAFHPYRHVAALTSLLDETRNIPSRLYALTPREFELFVGSVLSSYYNCEVYHVGQTRDGGVDLIMVAADQPIMIQVKHRQHEQAVEGIDVVKLLFASLYPHGHKRGMVITTAHHFSKDASKWIHLPRLRDTGYSIELVAIDKLLRMLNSCGTGNEASGWETAIAFPGPGTLPISSTQVQPEFLRYSNSAFVLFSTEAYGYLFTADSRETCWQISVSLAEFSQPEFQLRVRYPHTIPADRMTELRGAAFFTAVSRLSVAQVESLMEMWRGYNKKWPAGQLP